MVIFSCSFSATVAHRAGGHACHHELADFIISSGMNLESIRQRAVKKYTSSPHDAWKESSNAQLFSNTSKDFVDYNIADCIVRLHPYWTWLFMELPVVTAPML